MNLVGKPIRLSAKLFLAISVLASSLIAQSSTANAAPVYPYDPSQYGITPAGSAWIDVPANQRTYMINRGMVEGIDWGNGDDVMRYLPSGESCTYASGNNSSFSGPKIYWTQVDGSVSSGLNCTTDITGVGGPERANIPIPFGFQVNFGGEIYDGGYLLPAGALIFGPELFTYGSSAASSVIRIRNSGIAPFGADLMPFTIANSPENSSYIWTAQTTVNGKQAFVVSWERIRGWTTESASFSFQTVLINDGGGNFTTWFNYDRIDPSFNNNWGYTAPYLFANLIDGKVGDNEFKVYSTKGFESRFDQCITQGLDGSFYPKSSVDFSNNIEDFSLHARSIKVSNAGTVQLFSDTMCASPVLGSDISTHKYFNVTTNDSSGVLAGWYVWNDTNPADLKIEITEFFPSETYQNLVDGGSKALISNSLNSNVPGRYIVGMINGSTVGDSALDSSIGRAPTAINPVSTTPVAEVPAAVVAVPTVLSDTKATVSFSYGNGILTKKQKANISKAVKTAGKDAKYEITGGVGDVLNVTTVKEKALAVKRANVVKAYLVKLGVRKSNISIKIKIYKRGIAPKTKILAQILSS